MAEESVSNVSDSSFIAWTEERQQKYNKEKKKFERFCMIFEEDLKVEDNNGDNSKLDPNGGNLCVYILNSPICVKWKQYI